MSESKEDAAVLTGRHIRFGWFALLLFATLGIILETMHGFKIGWYLDVGNETRRLMWRLAHAHGGLLAIVNIAFALTLKAVFPPMVLPSIRAWRGSPARGTAGSGQGKGSAGHARHAGRGGPATDSIGSEFTVPCAGRARFETTAESDIDILVIEESDEPRYKRSPRYYIGEKGACCMSGPIDLTWGWLRKADSDLATASRVVAGEGPYDTACYHAQQAIEKSLKALHRQTAVEAIAIARELRSRIEDLLPARPDA